MQYSFIINIFLHIFILLTFLTLFFFQHIAGVTQDEIDSNMKDILKTETIKFLDFSSQNVTITNWKDIESVSDFMIARYSSDNETIKDHNNQLFQKCIYVIILIVIIILFLVMWGWLRNIDMSLTHLMLENIVTFTLIGCIEVYFFINIASKYVPVYPDDAIKTVYVSLRSRLTNSN